LSIKELMSAKPPLKTAAPPLPRARLTIQSLANQSIPAPPGAETHLSEKTPSPPGAEIRPSEKVQTAYKQLSRAAVDLNSVSDELAKPIKVWEAALKKLNLGVPAWVETSRGGDEPYWWDRGVGYSKLKDGWGIALRTRSGTDDPHDDFQEVWAFNDAPRWLRIEGVGKLPDLLEALLKQAEDTTKKLRAKVTQANELAKAITTVADEIAALERK
jgi:hypothetical protein